MYRLQSRGAPIGSLNDLTQMAGFSDQITLDQKEKIKTIEHSSATYTAVY